MPGGRRGHALRKTKRRIEALVKEEREKQEAIPPPINAEHAALRERIAKAWRLVEWEGPPDETGLRWCTDESLHHAHMAFDLVLEEADLLARHGVDCSLYQRPG